jgi:3-isopropylmalate dehydrogenase
MSRRVVFLPGDGIGPEVADAARAVLGRADRLFDLGLQMDDHAFGGAAIDLVGDPLPPETLQACQSADAVFLGAVGGPKWDGGATRPEAGLLGLRQALGLHANLRPIAVHPALAELSPIRAAAGTDLLIVRELTGGLYFGAREEGIAQASDQCAYSRTEVLRVARLAFDLAGQRRGRLTSVDKANVLATSRLWRRAVSDLAGDFRDVALDHVLVDAMAMHLISRPTDFDVIVTENLFGDILSDEASVLTGSIGLAPSASLGKGRLGLFEPIHGSAPDIAGAGKANPIGAILSAALACRYSLDAEAAATAIERAADRVIEDGTRTPDLGGTDGTEIVTERVLAKL